MVCSHRGIEANITSALSSARNARFGSYSALCWEPSFLRYLPCYLTVFDTCFRPGYTVGVYTSEDDEKTRRRQVKMAKNTQPQAKQWSEISYLRCELDTQLKKDLAAWAKQKHDWFAYIEREVVSELRFSVHQDKYNNCIEARLTLLSQSTGVNTLVLQGRGPTILAAIESLFFKHYVVLERSWEDLDRPKTERYSDWG